MDDRELEASWYVIRSATRREFDALEGLWEGDDGHGFAAYCPQGVRWSRLRHGASEKGRVHHPLFPGYLFVYCRVDEEDIILGIKGVYDFLRAENAAGRLVPMAVPEHLVAGISVEEQRGVFDLTRPSKREVAKAERVAKGYKRNEQIVVINGPYAGFMSTVIRMTSRNRQVVVEGANCKLTFDVEDVDPVVEDGEKAA